MTRPEPFLITRVGTITVATTFDPNDERGHHYTVRVFNDRTPSSTQIDGFKYRGERSARDGHAGFVRQAMRGVYGR